MILPKLLSDESSIKFVTKGPCNGRFGSKLRPPQDGDVSEGDVSTEFSIDEPVKLSTMMASGFIIFKVVSENGEYLIVLDATKNAATGHAERKAQNLKYLCCLDLPSMDPEDTQNMNEKALSGRKPVRNL
ncbi:uncharacterized protein BCR38DRAFT_481860 [Pseudomassariella vexata]|uniref:Uncharacterized protein n=1 Tax=Pseudomassariella vexata TaxID=1141098 RepID=A0A1Y2E9W8_9PEZI|nr:uncharacterized protein BCR38DRAFT_481860 [Pseudomassariella vexata]ORY68373.1 hypothetical protein BCR38DRAFT_481860 [Pseudomassariella vexata]